MLPLGEPDDAAVVRMRGIVKMFGTVLAVDSVDLDVRRAEIHAILGENGAGKSTLMNCLFGLHKMDAGKVFIEGSEVIVESPRQGLALGIGMVHQHFKLVPSLTVAENVFLGYEIRNRLGLVDREEQNRRVEEVSRRYGLTLDPAQKVSRLSIGAQQRVEIVRALSKEIKLLVLDEPTAVLTPQEAEGLFTVLRGLVNDGLAVMLISHRLSEVLKVADRISVMRAGKMVATADPATTDERRLADLIIGHEMVTEDRPASAAPGPVRLSVEGITLTDDRGVETVRAVTMSVKAGEIVGIAGVAGNGQTELVEAITGLRQPSKGSIRIDGKDVARTDPKTVRASGLAHIPEDRMGRGVSLSSSVLENLVAGQLDDPRFGKLLLNFEAMAEFAARLVEKFDIRLASLQTKVRALSGGNIQKIVLARELEPNPAVIICCEPSRGLDIGASEFVYGQLRDHRDAGAGILLVSTELPEIMRLADRILVMHKGNLVGEFAGQRPSPKEIGRLMLGLAA